VISILDVNALSITSASSDHQQSPRHVRRGRLLTIVCRMWKL
jgi:hypothetical protein